jgi:4-amino-4-deoxy-L-arabinose transferase-like glycosyltransferase
VRLALTAILLFGAALRLWRLDQNGFGNEYYAAGVRSMSGSWHNFLYHAFDPAGFISVDKPPVAMWIQVAAVKLFGFHGMVVLLPQVLEGLAAIWLLYHLVQRRFGAPAGVLAALFLAVTPVSVAVDRSSNTESCLVLVLLLAAWALSRAAEEGRRRLLLLAMALVGFAFNVKMLAAFVVLPTFALVYFMGTSASVPRRLVDLTLGGLVLAAVSLSWIAVYELTLPANRPYAGTTDSNSELELVVGQYGIGRFVRPTRGLAPARAEATQRVSSPERRPRGLARLFVGTPAGPLRLANGRLAGQAGWLFPLAAVGLLAGAVPERVRRPLAPTHLALLLWAGWTATYAAVFSAAGGFFHFYYLAMLAAPLAALAGIGVMQLWRLWLAGGWRAALAPLALLVTAAWQVYVDASALDGYEGWQSRLHLVLAGGALLAAIALVVLARRGVTGPTAAGAFSVGLAALLVAPVAWALSCVLVAGNGALPSADLARLLPDTGGATQSRRQPENAENLTRMIAFLEANRQGERFMLATSSTTLAAPIIIRTGQPVMARGGFHGLDPILTPEKLVDLVAARQVRFVMLGDLSFISRRLGADTAQRPIAEWIRTNGRPVDPALWRAGSGGSGLTLYDLRPDAALAPG